jgi:hypothetical protein
VLFRKELKRHTIENHIVSDELTSSCGGRKHDYTMFKETELVEVIPVQCCMFVDLGFQGMQTD